MQSQLFMIVAYYKAGPHPTATPGYLAVCNLDRSGQRPHGFAHYDDRSSVVDRNHMYCELSALSSLDFSEFAANRLIGLSHYRRVFTAAPPRGLEALPGLRRIPQFDWARPELHGADVGSLEGALGNYRWGLPRRWDVRSSGHRNLFEQFAAHHHPGLLVEASSAAAEITGRKPTDFTDFLTKANDLYQFNMFIARAAEVRAYLEFLWPVLARVEDAMSELVDQQDPYSLRAPGFVAERLFTYWICALRESRDDTLELDVLLLDRSRILDSCSGSTNGVTPRQRDRIAALVPVLSTAINANRTFRYRGLTERRAGEKRGGKGER